MQRSRVMMTTIEEVDGLTDGTIMTSVTYGTLVYEWRSKQAD